MIHYCMLDHAIVFLVWILPQEETRKSVDNNAGEFILKVRSWVLLAGYWV